MQQELQQQGGVLTQTSPFQKAHRRSASSGGSGSGSISQQDAFNVAGGPPLGFRFGAGSCGNRRPLSPAKLVLLRLLIWQHQQHLIVGMHQHLLQQEKSHLITVIVLFLWRLPIGSLL